MKEYYEARAAEYDDWYLGLGRFDGSRRSAGQVEGEPADRPGCGSDQPGQSAHSGGQGIGVR